MNRIKILFTIATTLLLAGCAKEPVAPDGDAITVEASLGAATKVSAGGDAFTAGDQIAVYAWMGSATANPATRVVDGVVNTFDGTSWTPAAMMRWQVTNDPHYFLGVYPATKAPGSDFTAVPYTITGSAAADDLLLATTPAGVTNTGAAVQLGFHHTMARLDVNLRFRNEWTSVPTADHVSVSVEAQRSASVNYLTETVTASGTASNVALAPATAATGYALGYSGLQVPQDGVKKIIVEVDGFEYVFASANDIPLTSGKYTTLNLVLGKDKLELAGVSVSDWTATTLSGVEADPTWALATPLTIEAKEAGAGVRFDIFTEEATNPVYYRTHDGVAWSDWAEYSSGTTVTLAKVGDKVQFKGNNARYARGGKNASTFAFSKDCYVYGNIMSLITSADFSICTTFTEDYALQNLFYGNAHIQWHPTQELLLPATKLSEYCYKEMFSQSSVSSSPKLPAKTLMTGCYDAMFWHSALKVAPELPATTLRSSCYREMFFGCADLTTAPTVLPATTLEDSCYEEMFSGCTSLTTAPKLAATTLADLCCYRMFDDCTSLTTIPDNILPVTTLESGCYSRMFYGCSKLATVPDTMLPATTLAANCYTQMFGECTGLTTAPNLPATELAFQCYAQMFQGCTSLTTTPTLSFATVAENCCLSMFYGCTKLNTVPVLSPTIMEDRCYESMFANCSSLTAIPAGMLPATNLAEKCYYGMFSGCTSLNSVPSGLLLATNLEKYCYDSMFEGCTSMTTGPILPAEKLVKGCYGEMFASCSSLSSVTCLAKQGFNTNPKTDWLKGVAATGTLFHVTYPEKYNGDTPSGWTLELYYP